MAETIRTRYNVHEFDKMASYDSAADALHAAGMDWDVELEPLQTARGADVPARAVVRTDNFQAVGVVGLRYSPTSNREASQWLDLYRPHGVRITGAEQFKGGQRCVMYADIGEKPAEIKRGDMVKLQLVASWSHDGSSGTVGQLRIIRLACLNGLCMVQDAGKMFNLRHTRNANVMASHIQDQVQTALAKFGTTIEAFRHMASKPAACKDVREYAREVLELEPDATLSSRGKNTLDAIVSRHYEGGRIVGDLLTAYHEQEAQAMERQTSLLDGILSNYESGRGQELNGGATWWNAYNAITEHLTHDRGRNDETRAESMLFGEAARINERALSLALTR